MRGFTKALLVLAIGALPAAGCGGGGGGGGNDQEVQVRVESSEWDVMSWDDGTWG